MRERALPSGGSAPSEERSEGRREAIFRAALEVFSRRGFHQASLDEIARAAGVGKGTIYLYVPDKEGLLHEAIRHSLIVHDNEVHENVGKKDRALEKLYVLVYLEYEFLLSNVQLAKVLFAERTALGLSDDFQAAMSAYRRRRKELVVAIMKEGQQNKELRHDVTAETLALVFTGMNGGAVFDILFDNGPRLDPEEAAKVYLDLFLRGAST